MFRQLRNTRDLQLLYRLVARSQSYHPVYFKIDFGIDMEHPTFVSMNTLQEIL